MVRYGWCDNSYSICDIIRTGGTRHVRITGQIWCQWAHGRPKNGGQQSKAVGQKRERYILYIPRKGYFCFIEEDNRPTFALSRRDGMIEHFENMKEAMLIVSRLKAKRYQILDVKGNVVKKGG